MASVPKPYIKILEQPTREGYRFRYQSEGRTAGSLKGEGTTKRLNTYPAIEIVGYSGQAVIVVSCVSAEKPYRPHPNKIVGKGTKCGVLTHTITAQDNMRAEFKGLGIQCFRKQDVGESLVERERVRVDPFKQGFNHDFYYDPSSVRLCFQAYLQDPVTGKFKIPLSPVVTHRISDKKSKSKAKPPVITKLSHCVESVDGGKKDILLLCENIAISDIVVRFYQEQDSETVWENIVEPERDHVFHGCAMWFKSPAYHNVKIEEPVKVFLQLMRPSDGALSEPRPFEFLPISAGAAIKRKRWRSDLSSLNIFSNAFNTKLEEEETNIKWNIALNSSDKVEDIKNKPTIARSDSLEIDSDVLNSLERCVAAQTTDDRFPDISSLSLSP